MFCTRCGCSVNEQMQVCPQCGASLNPQATAEPNRRPQYRKESVNMMANSNTRLIESDEKPVASLKNGIIANIITGEGIQNEEAFITQKRLYYTRTKGFINRRSEHAVIELKDISATKLYNRKNFLFLICSLLGLVAFILAVTRRHPDTGLCSELAGAAVVLFFLFIFSIQKAFSVEYAGGNIRFSVKNYSMDNMHAFQRAIHYYKNHPEQ